ncbi:MAG: aldo/keto reductase [Bacteroidales bacterium]|nr:aldo/keto reductase [Bacteroidales bacterium]MDD3201696.1 aldo/keto reductase [Bacteroidales bacterium]
MENNNQHKMSRREALKIFGTGTLGLVVAGSGISAFATCAPKSKELEFPEATVGKHNYKDTDEQVSMLAFGMMRLPMTGENVIDEELAQQLVDYAYAHGVNYFDTAWNYISGTSEPFTGKALKKYPRETLRIATKMPSWLIDSLETGKKTFQTQLDRLQTTYIDYYLLHALSSKEQFENAYQKTGVLEYLKGEKAAGRIRHLGFSFHGDMDSLEYILNSNEWDFVQIQLNYYDWDLGAKEQYETLHAKGIPIMVMEPCRGGMLAKLTPDAEKILKQKNPDSSIASWAFRYCASLPGVLTILSGMNVLDHVKDNIHTLSNEFKPLDVDEKQALEQAVAIFKKTRPVRCTACRYCMPCPKGVLIPDIFAFYNDCVNDSVVPDLDAPDTKEFRKRKKEFMERYAKIPEAGLPEHCVRCQKCVRMCPQHINIPDELSRIAALVESVKNA